MCTEKGGFPHYHRIFISKVVVEFEYGYDGFGSLWLKKEAAAGGSCGRLSFLRRYFCHLIRLFPDGLRPRRARFSFAEKYMCFQAQLGCFMRCLLYCDDIFLCSPVRLHEYTVDLIEVDCLRVVSDALDERGDAQVACATQDALA